MNDSEKFREVFLSYAKPVQKAIKEEKLEEAFSHILKGLNKTKRNNDREIADALLSLQKSLTVILEDKYGSKKYKEDQYNINGEE